MERIASDVKLEGHDGLIAAEILVRIHDTRPVLSQQMNFLNEQSIDFKKILALIGLQALFQDRTFITFKLY
jgi:hypothetical protein